MTQDESNRLRDEINAQPESIAEALGIPRDKCGRGWVCPKCGSGSGPHGTGPMLKKGRFKCWACNDWGGDAVEIIQTARKCGYHEALEIGARMLGLSIDGDGPQGTRAPEPEPDSQTAKPEEPEPDRSAEISAYRAALPGSSGETYLAARGISLETAEAAGVGFAAAWRHPKTSEHVPMSPRLILPAGKSCYTARDIRPAEDIPEGSKRYVKQKVGREAPPFNARALAGARPVFVVEGEIDALSILEVGAAAVAIGGTSGVDRLLRILSKRKADGREIPPLIVAMDNDKAGSDAAKKLQDALTDAGYYALTARKLYGDAKDANDALIQDRPALAHAVYRAALQAADRVPADDITAVLRLSDRAHFDQYRANRKKAAQARRISTGIQRLDKIFGGGLYAGLFTLGGDTGAGKTSFVLQVADSIAASGHPVLYVALEMSRDELIAKSVSRITAGMDAAADRPGWWGVPYRDLMNGRTDNLVLRAEREYRQTVAGNRFVMEGLGDVKADHIRARATALRAATGTAPVIIVDYLQNMAAHDPHMTERQAVEHNMKSLKLISRDLDTPVIVLSSLNRESLKNTDNIGLYSFKESGCIEYTADAAVLLIKGGRRPLGKEPGKGARAVALQVAKNRRGPVPPAWICLDFYAGTSRFVERCAIDAPWKAKADADADSEYAAFDAEEIFRRMDSEQPAEPARQLQIGA